jgi:hypothetical protein
METYLVSLVSAYQADSRHPQAALGNRSAAYSQQRRPQTTTIQLYPHQKHGEYYDCLRILQACVDSCQTEVAEFIGVNCLQSSLSSCSSRPARAASASHRVGASGAMRCCFSIRLTRRRDADAMRRHPMLPSVKKLTTLPIRSYTKAFPWC